MSRCAKQPCDSLRTKLWKTSRGGCTLAKGFRTVPSHPPMMEKPSAVIDAHATHWASLYPDAPDAIRARIKNIVAKSSIIAQVELPETRAMPNGGKADTLTAMAEADGDVRHMVLLLTERQTSSGCVLSAFPFAAGAITHPVKVEHVASTGSGAEGQVRGRTEDGAELSFFDTLF